MKNALHRLKFLLTATDEHGVHSPFIFNYVTKCLYAKPEYCRGKSQNILFKSIAYFGAQRVGLPAGSENLQAELHAEFPSMHLESFPIEREFPTIALNDGPYDILFTHPSQAKILLTHPFQAKTPLKGAFKEKDILLNRSSHPKIPFNQTSAENLIHNDTLLLVDGIHDDQTHLSLWKNIKNHPKVTVTVDLFHCGALFFRREQANEHFKIRI